MTYLFNFRSILYVFLFLFAVLEVSALHLQSHYVYDIPMCTLLLFVIYLLRIKLKLLKFHFLLLAIFLLLHSLGLYDAYTFYPLGFEYDYWVHAYFGFVASLIIFRWLFLYLLNLQYQVIFLFTVFFVMGASALHELYEYFGALILGEGEGVLFIGAGDLDQWDTQKDMLNNLLGVIIGTIFVYFNRSLIES